MLRGVEAGHAVMKEAQGGRMVTVAGIQLACGPNREENLAKALDLARVGVERGAKILCFAECFAWPWFPRKEV